MPCIRCVGAGTTGTTGITGTTGTTGVTGTTGITGTTGTTGTTGINGTTGDLTVLPDVPDEPDEQCTDNLQCVTGLCIRGQCICIDNTQCPSGLCIAGQCSACIDNAQCPTDHICSNGSCVLPLCGNGTVEPPETCDDGNVIAGDGCNVLCFKEEGQTCVDDLQCDSRLCVSGACISCASDVQCGADRRCVDGACFSSLQIAELPNFCGNARLDAGEECDEGIANSNDPNAKCREDCRVSRCGDGVLDSPLEICDDGNILADDGCSPVCTLERGAPPEALPASVIELPFVDTPVVAPASTYDDPVTGSTVACTDHAQCPTGFCFNGICGRCTQNVQCPTGLCSNGYCVSIDSPATTPATTPDTGPATVAIMSAGAAAGYAWMRRRRKT